MQNASQDKNAGEGGRSKSFKMAEELLNLENTKLREKRKKRRIEDDEEMEGEVIDVDGAPVEEQEEEEEEGSDEGPEVIQAGEARNVVLELKQAEEQAVARYEASRRERQERELQHQQLARIQYQQKRSNQTPVEVLPAKLLEVLDRVAPGNNEPPVRVQVAQMKAKKRETRLKRKLSDVWSASGIELKTNSNKAAVVVQLPNSLQSFLVKLDKEVPRAPVDPKGSSKKRTRKKRGK